MFPLRNGFCFSAENLKEIPFRNEELGMEQSVSQFLLSALLLPKDVKADYRQC